MDRRPHNATVPRGFAECRDLQLIDRDRCNTKQALQLIAGDPMRFLRRLPTKLVDLLSPTSFLIRHIRWGLYGIDVSPGAVALVVVKRVRELRHLLSHQRCALPGQGQVSPYGQEL